MTQEIIMQSRNVSINSNVANPRLQLTRQRKPFPCTLALLTLSLMLAIVSSAPAFATTLSSSGTLLLPPNCPGTGCGNGSPGYFPTITPNDNTFTGVFPNTAGPAYAGQFSGTGPYPNYVGTSHFDFGGLANGFLPSGSIVYFGDLDNGSKTNESFSLQAYGNPNLLSSAWLESAFYLSSQNPGNLVQSSMPSYDWSSHPGTYLFSGNSVPGNPVVGVWLKTNQDIYSLDVTGTSSFAGFAIAAPTEVPEPGSLVLLGSGLLGLGRLLRRRLLG
jgi:hypothetical protein